jgi:insulysin
LACFRPDNFNITVASRQFSDLWKHKEKWYGTEYGCEKIPAELLKQFDQASKTLLPELHLPLENQFIPRNLEAGMMDEEPESEPRLIRNDSLARVWFKRGLQIPGYKKGFQVPRAYLIIHCRNPFAHATAKTFVTTKLYEELVKFALKEVSYDASLAGLRYSIKGSSAGIKITVSGYVELSTLLNKLLTTMRDLQV